MKENQADALFARHDTDHDGKLDYADLHAVMSALNGGKGVVSDWAMDLVLFTAEGQEDGLVRGGLSISPTITHQLYD